MKKTGCAQRLFLNLEPSGTVVEDARSDPVVKAAHMTYIRITQLLRTRLEHQKIEIKPTTEINLVAFVK